MTILFLPKVCGPYINYSFRILPEIGYSKKKESEGHVSLKALELLHKNGAIDDYLVPNLGVPLVEK